MKIGKVAPAWIPTGSGLLFPSVEMIRPTALQPGSTLLTPVDFPVPE